MEKKNINICLAIQKRLKIIFFLPLFFLIYLVKNMIFRKDLESPFIFIFFLRENKIRKKTLILIIWKIQYVKKPKLSLGSSYLLGRYGGEP